TFRRGRCPRGRCPRGVPEGGARGGCPRGVPGGWNGWWCGEGGGAWGGARASRSAGPGGAEAAAVLGRGRAERFEEGAPHGLGRAVAAGARDLLDTVRGVLQQAPGVFEAYPVDVAARCRAGLLPEGAGEVAGRQA